MIIRHSNRYGLLSEERLQAFEREIGARLPEDYRRYMLQHNGGRPDPDFFEFRQGDVESASTLSHLYAIHDGRGESRYSCPLQHAWREHTEPADRQTMIPIGQDPFGNLILMYFAGPDSGAVCFVDHEGGGAWRIADSFSAFLDSLITDPDPQEPNYGECPNCAAQLQDIGPDDYPMIGCRKCGWAQCSHCCAELHEHFETGCPKCGWGRATS